MLMTKLLVDAFAGIAHCHSKLTTHNDLKADNVFLFWDEETGLVAKVGGFGFGNGTVCDSVSTTGLPDEL